MDCKDMKCPVHNGLKTHKNEIEGTVVSDKAKRTVIIECTYNIFLHKYERSLRKNSRVAAHNPECIDAKTGDRVIISGTRRLSKTKSFVVTKVIERRSK